MFVVRTFSIPVRQALKVALRGRGLAESLEPVALLPVGRIVCRDACSRHAAVTMLADDRVAMELLSVTVESYPQEIHLLLKSYEIGWSFVRRVAQHRAEAQMQPRDTDPQVLDIRSRNHVLGLTAFRFNPRARVCPCAWH